MKTLALTVLAGLALLSSSTGCQTPAYTAQERSQLIARNWNYEYEQIQDDIDSAFLLRPASRLSFWSLQ